MKNLNYICVIGYGRSGSSACIDLLKEFEGLHILDGEFRIAKDPHGLLDLESALVDNWDFMRSDIAIRDFISYCHMLSRGSGLFKRFGKDFENKININFMNFVEEYVHSLTDFLYFGDSAVHRYSSSSLQAFVSRIRSKLNKSNAISTYFSKPSEDFFINKTQFFLDNLFVNFLDKGDTIVLDQSISPVNIKNTKKYFRSSKVIVVDRDPRDIYIDLVEKGMLIGADLNIQRSADKFIEWYGLMRNNLKNEVGDKELSKCVLRLNFEDLVCDYEKSVKKINIFFKSNMIYKSKYKFFNPKSYKTKANVGLWKMYKNQDIINKISDKLPQYCININTDLKK